MGCRVSLGTLRATNVGMLIMLDAVSLATGLKGDSAGTLNAGLHHSREVQMLSLGTENAPSGGPTKRMKKPVETARAPAKIRELFDSPTRVWHALARVSNVGAFSVILISRPAFLSQNSNFWIGVLAYRRR